MRFAVVPHSHEDGSPDEHEVIECPSEGDARYEPGAIAIFAERADADLFAAAKDLRSAALASVRYDPTGPVPFPAP